MELGSAIDLGGGGGGDWEPRTYVEELDVVEDMVVVGKVVGGDDVDAGILLDLPVGETEPLGLGEEVILGELASPVGLVGLFEITEDTNAALGGGLAFGGLDSGRPGKDLRKPQHGGGHHLDCGGEEG